MSRLVMYEGVAPGTPPAGVVYLYPKADGKFYFKASDGVERPLQPTGGDLLADGTVPLTANWDVGSFKITALQFESDIVSGTAPFIVASNTVVTNLNADLLDGFEATAFVRVNGSAPLTANWDVGSFKITAEQIESDVATGTAPLIVASETEVVNLRSEFTSSEVASARNESGGTLTRGTPVYISGYSIGQEVILITGADSSVGATMPAVGIVLDDILNNATGTIVASGTVAGFNTSGFSAGDALYVSETAGQLTNTKPQGAALIQKIGICLRSHATLGVVEVVGAGRSNDLPNLSADNVWIGDTNGVPTELKNNLSAAVDPTVNDDSGAGYAVGSRWANTTLDKEFVCFDATATAAVWRETTGGGGGMPPAEVKTANYTAVSNEVVPVDTSGGAFTITLPASPSAQDRIIIDDRGKSCGTTNCTIARNGKTIDGAAEDFVIDQDSGRVDLVYDGTSDWDTHLIGFKEIPVPSGTFAPTLLDSTLSDAEGQTYTEQTGAYRLVGDVCFFWLEMIVNSLGTLTTGDNASIGGLPYTAKAIGCHSPVAVGVGASLAITAGNTISGAVLESNDHISLQKWSATTGTVAMTVAEVSTGGRLVISGNYVVA